MDWKREAIEKLKKYEARKQAARIIPEQIRELELVATNIRSATTDGTPVKGGGSGREEMLLNNIALRQELSENLKTVNHWLHWMNEAMAAMSDEERLILDRFFICPMKGNVERLCDELGIEKTQVYNKRDAALRHFTIVYYGALET